MEQTRTNRTYPQAHAGAARIMKPRILATVMAVLLGLAPLGLAQTEAPQSTTSKSLILSRADRAKVIYVADFELDPSNLKQDRGGITSKGYLLPPPPKSFLRRKQQDPAIATSNLVQLMSESLVADFREAGFRAQRLSSTEARPTEGLLVTGVFTEVDEGNQMRRALIGFGSGKTKMELYLTVADLACADQWQYERAATKSSGKKPGAFVALNPYVAAVGFVAKFGMTKNAPEKMVKKTAQQIATQLAKQLNTDSLIAAEQALNNH